MTEIIQGGKAEMTVRLINGQTQDPFDLTTMSDIKTCFENTDGTELMLSLLTGEIAIVGNPLIGKITISIPSAKTELMKVEKSGILELSLILTVGSDPLKVQIQNAYAVSQGQC